MGAYNIAPMEPSRESSETSSRGELDDTAGPSELELGPWRVQPTLNRIRQGASIVRIEPKLMDVLLLLARRAPQVVSQDELAAAVWPDVFVSESVFTRAIAGLRKALGDDARSPRFIETIAKRGYRLLVSPVPVRSAAVAPAPKAEAVAPPRPAAPALSARAGYAVGQWVRGERFYGREREIAEILDGPRNGLWVLGGRAIGKTSLLKQLEHVTANDPASAYVPLFWDLQGTTDPEELASDFYAALSEAEDRFGALGLNLGELADEDFPAALGRLRRALRARGKTLLLLWDEVEELLRLQARSPGLLSKLRRALQSQEGVRTVIASGPRLWQLADQRDDTSPFLHGFAPPLYLGPLAATAARDLVLQAQAPRAGERLEDPAVVELVQRVSGCHPWLLQLLSARMLELGDPERAIEAVATDPTVRFLLAVDHDLLASEERALLQAIVRGGELEADAAELGARLAHLEGLGFVRREGETVVIANPILERWLLAQKA